MENQEVDELLHLEEVDEVREQEALTRLQDNAHIHLEQRLRQRTASHHHHNNNIPASSTSIETNELSTTTTSPPPSAPPAPPPIEDVQSEEWGIMVSEGTTAENIAECLQQQEMKDEMLEKVKLERQQTTSHHHLQERLKHRHDAASTSKDAQATGVAAATAMISGRTTPPTLPPSPANGMHNDIEDIEMVPSVGSNSNSNSDLPVTMTTARTATIGGGGARKQSSTKVVPCSSKRAFGEDDDGEEEEEEEDEEGDEGGSRKVNQIDEVKRKRVESARKAWDIEQEGEVKKKKKTCSMGTVILIMLVLGLFGGVGWYVMTHVVKSKNVGD